MNLKRRSTTSGTREHSITRDSLGMSSRRLSSGTPRSSANAAEMFWENGGTKEEISAAALKKEKRHREREARSREDRDRGKDEKREKKHRSKSSKSGPYYFPSANNVVVC